MANREPSGFKSDSDLSAQVQKNEYISDEKGLTSTGFIEDPELTKKLHKKVDWRLIPVLTMLYLMSYMDRSLIGNARIAGLQADLELSDLQYNLCLTIFFIPYALFEIPANVMLKLLKPVVWLTVITLSWGTVMTLTGYDALQRRMQDSADRVIAW